MKLSATTLLDGHVLVAGGNDGTQDLATAEIFDVDLGIFWATSSMLAPRSGHLAMLLPHNNSVLIAGGTSNGAAVTSVERFVALGRERDVLSRLEHHGRGAHRRDGSADASRGRRAGGRRRVG